MTEKNADNLRRALDQLPEHDPPAGTWTRIGAGLDRADRNARSPLADRLPTYAPPTDVWNDISRRLPTASAAMNPTTEPVARHPFLRLRQPLRLAVAALVILTLGTVLYLSVGRNAPSVSYAYHQEPAPAPVTVDWDEEEDSFDRVLAEIDARNEPQLNNLGSELDELTAAREEVKAMLVAYGEDPTVVRQLAEIERERSDVYRRIIVEL